MPEKIFQFVSEFFSHSFFFFLFFDPLLQFELSFRHCFSLFDCLNLSNFDFMFIMRQACICPVFFTQNAVPEPTVHIVDHDRQTGIDLNRTNFKFRRQIVEITAYPVSSRKTVFRNECRFIAFGQPPSAKVE